MKYESRFKNVFAILLLLVEVVCISPILLFEKILDKIKFIYRNTGKYGV